VVEVEVCLMVAGGLIPLQIVNLATWDLYPVLYDGAVKNPLACSPAVEVCGVPNGGWRFKTPETTL